MAEPVTLYPAKGGDPIVCAAPLEVRRLLKTGNWLLEEPKPEPIPASAGTKPAPKPRKAAEK